MLNYITSGKGNERMITMKTYAEAVEEVAKEYGYELRHQKDGYKNKEFCEGLARSLAIAFGVSVKKASGNLLEAAVLA